MSNNKKISIEWLFETYRLVGRLSYNHFEEAKRMHKQEIIDAVGVGSQFDRDYLYEYHDKAEKYYNETFKDNESI